MMTIENILKLAFSACLAFGLLFTTACGSKQDQESSAEHPVETEVEVEMGSDSETATNKVVEVERPEPVNEVKSEGADLEKTYLDASGNTVYNHVETEPAFVGGNEALYKYLSENIEYPADSRRAGAEGPVEVSFIVASDGSIRDVAVLHAHEDASLNGEATRVISNMPAWEPGMVSGKAVDTKFTLPINFQLD